MGNQSRKQRGQHKRNKKVMDEKALAAIRIKTSSRGHETSTKESNNKSSEIIKKAKPNYLKPKAGMIPSILIFPFKRKNLLTTISLAICATSFLTFLYLTTSNPTEIRAELTQLGDIEFTYTGKQNDAISPLCGCYSEQPRDKWRGITFPARYLQINREGSKPLTGYMMTAAVPSNISWLSSIFQLQGSIYTFALPVNEYFDPRYLLNDKFPETYRVLNIKKYDSTDHFLLISAQGLNVALLGDMPLGSWIPTEGSQVTIKYRKEGMHLNAPNVAIIEEKYKNTESNVKTLGVPNIPLGDFLGPNVIFWSEDKSAVIKAGGDILQFNQRLLESEKVIHAIVTQPSFSVRVGADPLEKELVDRHLETMKNSDLLPDGVNQKYSRDELVVIGQLDDGKMTISIIEPEKQSEDFDAIYSRNYDISLPTYSTK